MRSVPSWDLSHLALLVALLLLFVPAALALPPQSPAAEVACPSCEDFNFCNVDSCDTSTGTCRHTPPDCDDQNPCTVDTCHISFCSHTHLPAGTACDDGSACTVSDACNASGACMGASLPPGEGCDDGNSCTTSDTCDAAGDCVGTASTPGSACDDQSLCTSGDTCVASPTGPPVCQGTSTDCGDGDLCTQDLCAPATGQCNHPPVDCNDGNSCTGDSCDSASGNCLRTPLTGACEDGDINCTLGDFCSAGNCVAGAPRNCDDHIACTIDTCFFTCAHRPDDSFCPPDTPCHRYRCSSTNPNLGGCMNLLPNNFFAECDGNPCNIDRCQGGACLPGGFDVNGPCDDHNPCTTNDQCGQGQCHGTALCDDGNVCTADVCSPMTAACTNQPLSTPVTCGLGACQRTLDTCAGGVFHPCVPGTPAPEECNGVDDDCDGLSDETRVQADCVASPSTLNLNSQGGSFTMTCKLLDVCDPANPVPISGSTVSQVYISRLDSADSSADDVTLPDPTTLPCPDPVLGFLYERGISENLAARDVSNANVTFKFNIQADGNCSTLDGDRQDIAARLATIPDNTSATVCISGKTGGADFQACVSLLVHNKGLR